jgi:hypothetical protein
MQHLFVRCCYSNIEEVCTFIYFSSGVHNEDRDVRVQPLIETIVATEQVLPYVQFCIILGFVQFCAFDLIGYSFLSGRSRSAEPLSYYFSLINIIDVKRIICPLSPADSSYFKNIRQNIQINYCHQNYHLSCYYYRNLAEA